MLGKKDNHDIFNQYKSLLLEQVDGDAISSLLNKIKTSQLDSKTKTEILNLLSMPEVKRIYSIISAQKQHGVGDADAAGYSSYPDAKPAQDMDEEEKPRKYDYSTGRYEGESDRERYERAQRDAKVMSGFGK
jgi:hypothetical protein